MRVLPARVRRGERPPPAPAQVAAVLAIRVAALRGATRRRASMGLAMIPLFLIAACLAGAALPRSGALNALILMPTGWLVFAAGAALAAIAGAGGRALLPPDQGGPFPLTPAADHLGAALMAPLNLSWLLQAAGLVSLTAWGVGPGWGLVPAELVTLTWMAVATLVGQAVGWLVELVRTTTVGVWVLRGALAAALAGALSLLLPGRLTQVLDQAPTQRLVLRLIGASEGRAGDLMVALAELALLGIAAWVAGVLAVRAVQRRPRRSQTRVEARDYPGRTDTRGDVAASLRIDRAGVWRSAPLRRGLVALAAIPGLAAAAARPDWAVMVMLPGLVISGAGLLFGVNAFCLDGSGALWRETLPGPPRALLLARLLVISEVCVVGALVTLAAAGLRARDVPTGTELAALAGVIVAATAQVAGRCLDWSLERPYAATLRDARDQPAPPAAMAGYSARLAIATTMTGLLFWGLARAGQPLLVLAATVAITAWALRRSVSAVQRWEDPAVRGRVVSTVAGSPA